MTCTEEEFREKLRDLAEEIDDEYGEWPDVRFVGRTVFEYFLRSRFPDEAEQEIQEYYKKQKEVDERAADKWWEDKTEEEKQEMIKERRVNLRWLEEYNERHRNTAIENDANVTLYTGTSGSFPCMLMVEGIRPDLRAAKITFYVRECTPVGTLPRWFILPCVGGAEVDPILCLDLEILGVSLGDFQDLVYIDPEYGAVTIKYIEEVTSVPAVYEGQFRVEYADGRVCTYPSERNVIVEVKDEEK